MMTFKDRNNGRIASVIKAPYMANGQLRIPFSEDMLKRRFFLEPERETVWWVKAGHPDFTVALSQQFEGFGSGNGVRYTGFDASGTPHDALKAARPHHKEGRNNVRLITTKHTWQQFPVPLDLPEDDFETVEVVTVTTTPKGYRYAEVTLVDVTTFPDWKEGPCAKGLF